MPVPVPNTEAPAPRRLLRDVVFDKMLAAIGDGTLELGERLNDDELVRWLGVSRTPVREAIAKLADYGLVDIEANRYTRVISPTMADFADTTETAFAVWAIVVRRGVPKLSDAEAREVVSLLASVGRDSKGKLAAESLPSFARAIEIIATAAQSKSLFRLLETVGDRAALLLSIVSRSVEFHISGDLLARLRSGVEKRDGVAAAAAFETAFDGLGDYVGAASAAGVFPEAAPVR
ncbi:DNA-binding GntR family transcriptional regulator [Frondihabitans sp. PhB188]|uniref:GntR family transcriptional regulator n=1 Tax=Frondihabitans sp. PhB188 TaxID=2485200 RepID=UPI000F4902FE|nr:GntR family transcriptional regulator [Frondihabitans sp. PhB188]ROQ37181.1 DNA-binding GntR family transcriptional regulator [Frondihabitans sp. PhB188]